MYPIGQDGIILSLGLGKLLLELRCEIGGGVSEVNRANSLVGGGYQGPTQPGGLHGKPEVMAWGGWAIGGGLGWWAYKFGRCGAIGKGVSRHEFSMGNGLGHGRFSSGFW